MFYLTMHSTHFIYRYMATVHTKADVLGDSTQQVDDVEMLANVNENHQLRVQSHHLLFVGAVWKTYIL